MKRHWRRWLALLIVVLVGVVFGLRWYLSSYLMKARVTAQLEALYGGRLSVGGVDIGLNHSVLTGVEVYEDGQGPGQPPWLSIDRLEADVSLADLREGRQPSAVRVQGVTITLRFDDQGQLVTALPPRPSAAPVALDTLPAVELSDGRLILLGTRGRQQRVDSITASLRGTGSRYDIEATGRSSMSNWTAAGAIELSKKDLTITMRSDGDVKVTQPMLESLFCRGCAAWNEVQTTGTTPVLVTLAYDWGLGRKALRACCLNQRMQWSMWRQSILRRPTPRARSRLAMARSSSPTSAGQDTAALWQRTSTSTFLAMASGLSTSPRGVDIANVDVRQLPPKLVAAAPIDRPARRQDCPEYHHHCRQNSYSRERPGSNP